MCLVPFWFWVCAIVYIIRICIYNMYMYMYIYIYTHTHTHIYIYIYICTHIHPYTRTHMCLPKHVSSSRLIYYATVPILVLSPTFVWIVVWVFLHNKNIKQMPACENIDAWIWVWTWGGLWPQQASLMKHKINACELNTWIWVWPWGGWWLQQASLTVLMRMCAADL